ncbi:DUF4139 domain-containing protein [bacterium]
MKKILITFIILSSLSTISLAKETINTTNADTLDLELVIYQQNIALIKESRKKLLPKGNVYLNYLDVSSHLIPESVSISFFGQKNNLYLKEQLFSNTNALKNKLINKYIGKNVKIATYYLDGKKEILDAQLLGINNNLLFKIGNDIYTENPGVLVLPNYKDTIEVKSKITWLLTNETKGDSMFEISYLTKNISWSADYNITLNDSNSKAKLLGWATIYNNTNTDFKNASISLIAGDLNIEQARDRGMYGNMMKLAASPEMSASSLKQQKAFEYHLLDLDYKTDIAADQSKQISFISTQNIDIEKKFIFQNQQSHFYNSNNEEDISNASILVEFLNNDENWLGKPLPMGKVRFYQKDSNDKLIFIGEDILKNTPVNELIKMQIGKAFDITMKRTQSDFKRLRNLSYETEWKLEIKNNKDEDIEVIINEAVPLGYKLIDSSEKHSKKDAKSIEFASKIMKKSTKTLTYRVEIKNK